jgi:hypothetical protein
MTQQTPLVAPEWVVMLQPVSADVKFSKIKIVLGDDVKCVSLSLLSQHHAALTASTKATRSIGHSIKQHRSQHYAAPGPSISQHYAARASTQHSLQGMPPNSTQR